MSIIPNMRAIFKPVQPLIQHADTGVQYKEYWPDEHLQSLIYCYWELYTTVPLLQDFLYRVVADGCMDIFFDRRNPSDAYVMGFSDRYTAFPVGRDFHYIGIRFLPTMFPQLFNVQAHELAQQATLLQDVIPQTAKFLASSNIEVVDMSAIMEQLDAHFLRILLQREIKIDTRLYESLEKIMKADTHLHIEKDLQEGISARQLRRLFERYIGDTPKTFQKIVRFQKMLQGKPSHQALRRHLHYLDAGYYDQAHFIKEFKTLYGLTPNKVFEK
ncbi:helix-turn-helix protein [Chitinophaga skermanii]|uniref:Helix-turn-helix protein n=1 Tax=Chitinophaga skermanii TaxID=331697 RepID=A0A327QPJ2_9BACT|nr:helix-turn-helix domain-containing protein [Chitinophaga skermanii]RAJ06499.1 helix-turn-helix protein [Chitinophaga skermanii]